MRRTPNIAPLAFLALICAGACASATPDFRSQILPIFERSCYGCHGAEKQKSGYRLDVREIALKGGASGEAAIKPHDAEGSSLIRYVSGAEPEMLMPPKSSGVAPLTAEEIEMLRAWIDAGPAWPDELAGAVEASAPHWSLQPLIRPAVPNAGHPVDAFVSAKLAERNIVASPEADRRTLLRRVYYDLTGLPPTPEEVDAFEASADPLAYERAVDSLLASPRYGERWARHWLDTIHFADSHGYEHDIGRDNAWRYRDYVIDALNEDTPWQQFVREQIAADVFYPDAPELTPALGFLGAGTFDLSTYSTAPVTFSYLDRDDLVTQTMAAFTSTTANCARCHDHKFDPISQEDYYALQAVFAGVLKGDVNYDEEAAMARERRTWTALAAAAERGDSAALLTAENVARVEDWAMARGEGAAWSTLDVATYLSSEGSTLTLGEGGIIRASGKRPEKDTYTITATAPLEAITAFRLDLLADASLPMQGPGRNDNGNFHLSEFVVRVFEPGANEPRKLKIRSATADFNQTDWDIARAIDDDEATAWGIHPTEGAPHHAVFELEAPLTLAPGSILAISLKQEHGGGHLIGACRLFATSEDAERAVALPAAAEDAFKISPVDRTEEQRLALAAAATKYIAEAALEDLPPQAVVYAAAKSVNIPSGDPPTGRKSLEAPLPVHLLQRGDFDKPLNEVPPGALSALTHLPPRFTIHDAPNEAERRARLAEWIAHTDNVLTWRSAANRVWHYHFGRGLCDTPSDFGRMGGTPSHPELLDWLAVWFRDDAKGSLKRLHKLIVTSAAYKQSSAFRADAAAVDEDNRLVWRQNRHRLDADSFRDFVLATAGALDLKMGGPGVQHFTQAKGPQITPALDYRAYDWGAPGAGRRSIYRFVWRGIADPFMESLDFPDLGLLSPTRGFSASSLQALALFNNDFVLQQSAAFAARLQREEVGAERQARHAVRLAWFRDASDTETAEFASFIETRGLPMFCRVLLNSNEFMFVD